MPGWRANSGCQDGRRKPKRVCPIPHTPSWTARGLLLGQLVRQQASHMPLFTSPFPFCTPVPESVPSNAVRPPTRMKAKNTTDTLATALPLALKQKEASDWVLDAASSKQAFVPFGIVRDAGICSLSLEAAIEIGGFISPFCQLLCVFYLMQQIFLR